MYSALLITQFIQPIEASDSSSESIERTLPLDVTILGLGVLGYLGAQQIPITIDPPRSTPGGIDAWHEPQWYPKWKTTSDFLGTPYANYGFNLPVLTVASIGLWGVQNQDSMSAAVAVAQSVAITAAVTEMTKRIVGRPRPYTSEAFEAKYPHVYNSDEMMALRQENDAYKSFPSGHTSNAATTYFTSAALVAAHYDDPKIDAYSYATASILTVLTGYSRVRYGKHHISDTLAGAMLGTGLGFGMAFWRTHRNNQL